MAASLGAIMAPLAEAGRLATVPGRLTDLGVADVRVLADLMEPAGLSGLCSELLGERDVGFTPDELETIARVEQAVSRSATVLKRIRGNETHADDVHAWPGPAGQHPAQQVRLRLHLRVRCRD